MRQTLTLSIRFKGSLSTSSKRKSGFDIVAKRKTSPGLLKTDMVRKAPSSPALQQTFFERVQSKMAFGFDKCDSRCIHFLAHDDGEGFKVTTVWAVIRA
jgi:hypothetical protein